MTQGIKRLFLPSIVGQSRVKHKVNTLSMVVHSEMPIKVDARNIEAAIKVVKELRETNTPSFPFSYTFLDEHFAQLYRSDEQMSAVVAIMAMLAILISCMGLFGLAAITTEKKTKEIGIRKVRGASETQITLLLSGNSAKLIVLSFVLVSPVTYWIGYYPPGLTILHSEYPLIHWYFCSEVPMHQPLQSVRLVSHVPICQGQPCSGTSV